MTYSTSVQHAPATRGLETWLKSRATVGEAPLKVVFVVRNALGILRPGFSEVGGSELKTVQFARRLATDPSFDVSFVCWGPEDEEFVDQGVRVCVWKYTWRLAERIPVVRAMLAQTALMTRLCRLQADILIQSCAGMETVTVALAARLSRAQFVFWASSIVDVSGQLERMLGMVIGPIYAWGLRRADHVICQTEEQRQLVRDKLALPATVVPSLPPPIRANLVHGIERTTVLWIGHWTSIKGPEAFVELAHRFRDVPFEMVLSSRPSSLPGDLPRNLKLHFGLGRAEVGELLSRARVLVNTSSSEGFPNTFLEAAMAGTPILSLSANPDRILDLHQLGRCAYGNPRLLGRYLRSLLTNDALWRSISEQGNSYVEEHHDPAVATAALKELLVRTQIARLGRGPLRG
jgi:glycosyltransferase involved in cell wall biosynthesis